MRKLLTSTAALCALIALSVAGFASAAGEGPVTVQVGNLRFTANGHFTPKALPRRKPAPIALNVSGRIGTTDGSHPPALRKVELETDKNGFIDVKGIPTCRGGKLQSRDTRAAEKACGPAIIGRGTTNVEIAFPEQRPIPVSSKLLVVNGGKRGGTTTLFIHAYITVPTPAAIVTTVKIKKHRHGRFGIKSIARIPKIAGGSGSVTSFNLTIERNVKVRGKTFHPLTARCTDGKLQAHAVAKFADGTSATTEFVRACRPKR